VRFPCVASTTRHSDFSSPIAAMLRFLRTRLPSLEAPRSPRFLGDPFGCVPHSSTPPGPCTWLDGAGLLPSAIRTASAPGTGILSRLNRAAHTLAVYASRPQSPASAQDSLPAGCHSFAGRAHPAGSLNEVSSAIHDRSSSSRLRLAHSGNYSPCTLKAIISPSAPLRLCPPGLRFLRHLLGALLPVIPPCRPPPEFGDLITEVAGPPNPSSVALSLRRYSVSPRRAPFPRA
jgi:hypothetical protein